jgi:short-subunit dehydrogenase
MTAQVKKTAIVTGASSGIGSATAQALVQAGYTVFGTSRTPDAKTTDGVTMLPLDVTSDTSVSELVSAVLAATGQIDLLVNNAGLGLIGGAEESSIAQVQALFDVNLFGVIRLTNATLPAMRERRQGRIVNISSVLGLIPAPYSAHYSATKHALEGYPDSLDHEVRAFNIRISLVEPAYTRTVFDKNALAPDARIAAYDEARNGIVDLTKNVMATADAPEVVAKVVVAAARAREPRRRYTAGKVAKQIALLRRFVPAAAFDKSLRKQMQLPA